MLARKQRRRGKLISARREVIEQGRIRRGLERNLARQLVTTLDKIAARAGEQYEYNGFRAINRNAILQDLTAVIVPSVRATMTQMVERFIRQSQGNGQDQENNNQKFLVDGRKPDALPLNVRSDGFRLPEGATQQFLLNRGRFLIGGSD